MKTPEQVIWFLISVPVWVVYKVQVLESSQVVEPLMGDSSQVVVRQVQVDQVPQSVKRRWVDHSQSVAWS